MRNLQRNLSILRHREAGYTYASIGALFNIDPTRARGIVKELQKTLPRNDPFALFTKRTRSKLAQVSIDTEEQLINKISELHKVKGIGPSTILEIKSVLSLKQIHNYLIEEIKTSRA